LDDLGVPDLRKPLPQKKIASAAGDDHCVLTHVFLTETPTDPTGNKTNALHERSNNRVPSWILAGFGMIV
jgi:hypothetical protein